MITDMRIFFRRGMGRDAAVGACQALTFLLRRTMARHLLCSRPRKILTVFQ